MIQTTGAVLLLALLLVQLLSCSASSSSSSSAPAASCPFSNAGDQGHQAATPSHGHEHIDHAHVHNHQVHDHGSHAHDHSCGDHTHSHHDHDHDHHHHHHHHHHHAPAHGSDIHERVLAEELAEEEELRLYGFKSGMDIDEGYHHDHQQSAVSSVGLWMRALGCSLLVSMASLVCLIILPLIVSHGKPSRTVVDFLAAFGAGAMLGDAFLHQLPHALGGSHDHSHPHSAEHNHGHSHGHHGHSHDGAHGHAHSIQDLSVGLAVLAGILLFFIVEKIVRQVEKASLKGMLPWVHHHHHHHHHHHEDESIKQHLTEDDERRGGGKLSEDDTRLKDTVEAKKDDSPEHERSMIEKPYRRKKTDVHEESEVTKLLPADDQLDRQSSLEVVTQTVAPNLILGYLNLFSDGVHNFTDGMALGAAFLNHGTLGGWSRTLFLLAHELPQEVGDFGILVQSGFSVIKALAFNFLSALVALAGTAVALVLGGNPGHSSLIEGFTAGGFIYIAVAGVLPEMHQYGTSMKTTLIQLMALSLGMSVALTISLVE